MHRQVYTDSSGSEFAACSFQMKPDRNTRVLYKPSCGSSMAVSIIGDDSFDWTSSRQTFSLGRKGAVRKK
jgi:hypothetical protein